MRKLYQIYVDGDTDPTCLYYKSTAVNVVIPNIKRIYQLKGISYNKIELKEL